MEQVYAAIGIIIAISIIVLLFSLPVVMAKKRGRSAGGWLALSFLITPIWTAIILAILGDSKEKICSEIISEIQQTDVNKADVTKGKYTMGNGGFFFLGMITGAFLAALILAVCFASSVPSEPSEEKDSGLILFEQPADVIETASFEVQEVLENGNALAKSQHMDYNFIYYTDPMVLLLADEDSHYYDKQVVKVPKGVKAYQVGIYQYKPYYGTNSTLPVVQFLSK